MRIPGLRHFRIIVENRRRSMGLVLLASIAAMVLFTPAHLLAGCCHPMVAIQWGLILTLGVLYLLLRRGVALKRIETALMVCALVLFSTLVFAESLADTGAFWAAGFPFIAYFIMRVQHARYWAALYFAEILLAALAAKLELVQLHYSAEQLAILASVIGFYWLLAQIYQSQYEAQRQRLNASYRQIDTHRSRLKAILDHAPNSIWMVGTDGRIHFANPAMQKWTGLSEAELRKARDYTELLPRDIAERVRRADRECLEGDGEVCLSQERMPDAKGREHTFDVIRVKLRDGEGRVTGLVGFAIDISERLAAEREQQELERKMLHMQRLEALGMMAGGVAHDFNNLLTAMQGGVELARMDGQLSQEARESLDTVETAIRAATELCQQMLAYSGKGVIRQESLALGDLIEEMQPLLLASIGKHIELSCEIAPGLPPVEGDRGQIRQIILNMVINAAEAIDGRNGRIAIRLGRRHLPEARRIGPMADERVLKPGDYLVLEISDNGPGMSPDIQQHVFDPFFTTKFTGRGLGMSAVLGIVRAHHGALDIDSAPGQGTTMGIWLPAGEARSEDASAPAVSDAHDASPGSGTVLVIDDEPDVLRVASRMLQHLGYEVITAGDGAKGLEAYRRHRDGIDWVLLDMTMPQMNGDEVLKELRRLDPDVRVVMSSGYNREQAGMVEADAFLKKPYTLAALKQVCCPISR